MKDHTEDELLLSDHTISMRKALDYCQSLIVEERTISAPNNHHKRWMVDASFLPEHAIDAWEAARTLHRQRSEGLTHFWGNHHLTALSSSSASSSDNSNNNVKKEERVLLEVVDETSMTAREFRQRFLHGNLPCLVRGLDQTSHFAPITSQWRRQDGGSSDETKHSKVNVDWFVQHVGESTVVPIRQSSNTEGDHPHSSTASLDEDGRAAECTTVEWTLLEWVNQLEAGNVPSDMYLKDWHLVSMLSNKTTTTTQEQIYTAPPQFGGDLLNGFLTRFTQGDYRFVYWGPRGSSTALHSDVLHSFSWSYNVVGEKEWKFYPPSLPDFQDNSSLACNDNAHCVVVRQKAGETMFVPSGWKHEVTNLCETLSINHNWITSANIDRAWDCIRTELVAVEQEVQAWGMLSDDDWGARESMLRACVGLDVTAFFFLVLTEQQRLLRQKQDELLDSWESCFDLFRLHDVLQTLLCVESEPTERATALNSEPSVHLHERLSAVLESEESARQSLEVAAAAVKSVAALQTILQ